MACSLNHAKPMDKRWLVSFAIIMCSCAGATPTGPNTLGSANAGGATQTATTTVLVDAACPIGVSGRIVFAPYGDPDKARALVTIPAEARIDVLLDFTSYDSTGAEYDFLRRPLSFFTKPIDTCCWDVDMPTRQGRPAGSAVLRCGSTVLDRRVAE